MSVSTKAAPQRKPVSRGPEPLKFAYWVPNVSGGLVISKIAQRTDWSLDYNVRLAQIAENAQIGASIITIRSDNLTLRELLKQLSEQCGVQLEAYPPEAVDQPREKLRIDLDHVSFWDAMTQITEKSGFSLQQWDNGGMVLMQGGPPPEGISTVAGAFLVSAARVSRSRSGAVTPGASRISS